MPIEPGRDAGHQGKMAAQFTWAASRKKQQWAMRGLVLAKRKTLQRGVADINGRRAAQPRHGLWLERENGEHLVIKRRDFWPAGVPGQTAGAT